MESQGSHKKCVMIVSFTPLLVNIETVGSIETFFNTSSGTLINISIAGKLNPEKNQIILFFYSFEVFVFISNETRHLIGRFVEQPSIASPNWSVI